MKLIWKVKMNRIRIIEFHPLRWQFFISGDYHNDLAAPGFRAPFVWTFLFVSYYKY